MSRALTVTTSDGGDGDGAPHAPVEILRDEVLAVVAHELRNGLFSITGGLTVLSRHGWATDEEAELFASVRGDAERLTLMFENLLTLASPGLPAAEIEPVSLPPVLARVAQGVERLPAAPPVTLDIERGLPIVDAVPSYLEQVLRNLLLNAYKYAPGSPIDVSARSSSGVVEVVVADRGPGIPEADLPRVFEPFFRHREGGRQPGTGLGLAVCRRLLNAFEGTVTAANRDGGGLEVCVRLPVPEFEVD